RAGRNGAFVRAIEIQPVGDRDSLCGHGLCADRRGNIDVLDARSGDPAVKVVVPCDRCLASTRFDTSGPARAVACGKCGHERPVEPSEAVRTENRLDLCPVCGSGYFYREKDFNAW